jgi:anti-sigma regulatory factor (Ser/Thr protein kinase)
VTVFVKHVRGGQHDLAALRDELEAWLEAERVPEETGFDVKLVTYEAVRSAVAHAQPGTDVVVTAEAVGNEISVEVVDPSDEPWALEVPPTEDELTGLQLINGIARRVRAIPLRQGAALVMQLTRG